jgi:hypothetical protein
LLQKLAHDLRTTLAPIYTNILDRLLKLLPRSINAVALTALLETFSALFKFLLVPSIHLQLLEETWDSVRLILPKCLPEIQRAMAEVWGSVLRRLKTAPRARAVNLLAKNLEGVEDASAWAIVYACKVFPGLQFTFLFPDTFLQSVSQTLHTATTSIFTPLLAYHMTSETPQPTYTLIRRVLTALIHHVKNAGQFSPLADLLVEQFKTLAKSMDSGWRLPQCPLQCVKARVLPVRFLSLSQNNIFHNLPSRITSKCTIRRNNYFPYCPSPTPLPSQIHNIHPFSIRNAALDRPRTQIPSVRLGNPD